MGTMIQVTTEYDLVRGDVALVKKVVGEMIKQQWQPLGAAFPIVSVGNNVMADICQTMIKQGFAMVNTPGGGPSTGRITIPQLKIGGGGRA